MIERAQEYPKHDGHLTVYLLWPILAGFSLSLVMSICVAGLILILWRNLSMALSWAGVSFFFEWGVFTVGVFLYAATSWGGPLAMLRLKQPVQFVTQARPEEPRPPMVLNRYNEPPMLPAGSMEVEIDPLVADAAPELMELYNFITRLWPGGDISRETARKHGFDRAVWERLVGGVRGKEGMESGRGHLDRAGVVVHTGKGWQIAASLDQAYAINPDLLAYAQARAEIVTGRDGPDRTGQDMRADPVPRGKGRGKRGA